MSMSSPTSSPEDSPMSSHEDSSMSSDDDSPMSSHEDSPTSSNEDSPMSSPDDSELICSCGLPAKLIISRNRSPYRLFYNCPRGQYNQCGFRQWFDETMQTDNQHVDQINLISIECIQLQERINEIEEERGQERSLRFKERAELNSQLSAVKDEFNKIKSEIKPVNKSNPTSAGVTFQTMSMSSPEDSPISSYEDSPMSSPEGSSMSSPENSEVICFCGRLAKLRLSMTSKNPNRYFYNCPKRRNNQCDFFQWFDEPIPTGDRRVDEMNLISTLKDELDKIKSKIKQENDGLDKIKSEIKLENDGLVKIKSEIKLENDGLDNIKSEIKLENDGLIKIKSETKLENDGLDNIKVEIKLENDGLDIKTEIKLENESGSMPPLN
ncbi:hypothetical protein C3L33_02822, partial [Rhododendron williamsianum]